MACPTYHHPRTKKPLASRPMPQALQHQEVYHHCQDRVQPTHTPVPMSVAVHHSYHHAQTQTACISPAHTHDQQRARRQDLLDRRAEQRRQQQQATGEQAAMQPMQARPRRLACLLPLRTTADPRLLRAVPVVPMPPAGQAVVAAEVRRQAQYLAAGSSRPR